MSIFKKIGNVVSKVTKEVGRVAERAKEDILPVAAGIATGGASLALLPLSDTGAIGRATGGIGSAAANIYGSVGPGGVLSAGLGNIDVGRAEPDPTIEYVQEQGPVLQQQAGVDQGANNLINSLLGLAFGSVGQKSDVANSPQVGSAAPQVTAPQVQGMSPTLMLGIGGGLLAIVAVMVMGKK
jgi:hypothetical protein